MIGTHIKKNKTFYKSLTDFYETESFYKPVQIFTGSTKMWKRPVLNEEDNIKTLEYVTKNEINLFIHSIYLINLSRNCEECQQGLEALVYDLKLGPKIGAKGVVVHCGKSLKMDKTDAVNNMYKNVLCILEHINESCPLLIENCCGQGTEVLTTYKEFSDFYNRFTTEQKQKIKICIDTCHAFVSNHCPLEYIQNWNSEHTGSIVLVHYNDSKCEKGSRKDRHSPVGEGYIGIEKMEQISNLCNENCLPMVIE